MGPWKPITTEAALGTNTGAASNVGLSRYVRLFNTAAVGTEHLVTLEESGGTDIGTLTLAPMETVLIRKDATDKIFAANAEILLTEVGIYQG